MNSISRFYYKLTAYFPRKLPANSAELQRFCDILHEAYGLPDTHSTWITVSGQITSTPPHKLRRPWGEIANCALRLSINSLAQDFRNGHAQAFDAERLAKMEAAVKKMQAEDEANGQKTEESQSQTDAGQIPNPNQAHAQISEAKSPNQTPQTVGVCPPSPGSCQDYPSFTQQAGVRSKTPK